MLGGRSLEMGRPKELVCHQTAGVVDPLCDEAIKFLFDDTNNNSNYFKPRDNNVGTVRVVVTDNNIITPNLVGMEIRGRRGVLAALQTLIFETV